MSTAEYAVGTIAACGFAALLWKSACKAKMKVLHADLPFIAPRRGDLQPRRPRIGPEHVHAIDQLGHQLPPADRPQGRPLSDQRLDHGDVRVSAAGRWPLEFVDLGDELGPLGEQIVACAFVGVLWNEFERELARQTVQGGIQTPDLAFQTGYVDLSLQGWCWG
ncbi:DUF4244 domain-containing protein [Microbispora sp. GKU 823]|uniref:DUF4244 domain-containing protein n=1 Tax=Microbispora sp. GKU 823 TaxID=1652100 RepID=UPI002118B027|nr:DUF4244 domain-containing protein [Microbispora sp. GKU 823]